MEGYRGPEYGFVESGPAAEEMARAELCAGIAEAVEARAQEMAAAEISQDPLLQSMMSKLIESGVELDVDLKAHLRKMVALRIGTLLGEGVQAGSDGTFFRMLEDEISLELNEMQEFEDDVADLPDLWDLAYQDLLRLEGDLGE